jgi:hypothetical protein
LEEALFACRQTRMRRQKAGQELAQDGAKIRPGMTGGRRPMASRFHAQDTNPVCRRAALTSPAGESVEAD